MRLSRTDRQRLNAIRREHDARQAVKRRLEWVYGVERARMIDAHMDPEAERDLKAWENIGRHD